MQTPPPITPEQVRQIGDAMAENGRVLATLDDWRAIGFLGAFVIIFLGLIIWLLLRANRLERKEIADERARMWTVAEKTSEAANKLTSQVLVSQVLSARIESALGRVERILDDQDQKRGKAR